MLDPNNLLPRKSLTLLIELSKQKEPLSTRQMAAQFPKTVPTGNASLGYLTTRGLAVQVYQTGIARYAITEEGKQRIKDELEIMPLEARPLKPSYKNSKAAKAKKATAPAPAPPPAPNLSTTAEGLMGNISAVLEENARLRDIMQSIHNQLGALLYGDESK